MKNKKEAKPLRMASLLLYDGQMGKLQELYPGVGASKVIRILIDNHLAEIETKREKASERSIGTDAEGPEPLL